MIFFILFGLSVRVNKGHPNNVFKYDIGLARNIDEKIKSALKSTEQGLRDSEQKWGEVRNLIIKPMIKEFNNKDILFISPDGLLNNIPFSSFSV